MSETNSSEKDPIEDFQPYLQPATFVDSDHPAVIEFAQQAGGGEGTDLEKAVRLYYAVRDGFRYDPYGVEMTEHGMKGSSVLERGNGFCITKGALMAAACRVLGIPARLGFADVRNHLASKRMVELMGTDLFVYHGFVEVYLEGKWVKATPAFNLSLCEKFGTLPLEFDGRTDSIFHPFDAAGNKHMEYITEHGSFADTPFDDIKASFREHYPAMYDDDPDKFVAGDMEAEAEAERAGT
ncbi:MAG: transglutaminase family protein [Alphaproteobacteria bacterium]|jgi:transglutaminase-like putative cysteine protease|nr:transglutaminase family protein [Alphaproteobacteria bacterium]MDP6832910.1 transglutaminase family protein [Alphaproteobacteria bacterium]MDP6872338.1 transglutaminase family protein [Alphaproteobacteria bacterium]